MTLDIEGKGFAALAAEVGPHFNWQLGRGLPSKPRLHFEVYVDGKFAGHSGLMDLEDGPRLIVVQGLDRAKELRLVTRVDFDQDNRENVMQVTGVWGNPTLYK
jgi:hypothetical protein